MTVVKPRHLCLASAAPTCLFAAASDGQRGGGAALSSCLGARASEVETQKKVDVITE